MAIATGTAILAGAALGVGGSIISSKSASKAAGTQAASADRATQSQLQMYEQSREDMAPWRQAGGAAIGSLRDKILGKPIYADQTTEQGITGYKDAPGFDYIEDPYIGRIPVPTTKQVPIYGDVVNKGDITGYEGGGPGEFRPEEEPGYKFGYQEFVEKPTLRLAAATGKLGSGATLKALSRYASDYASQKYDNFLDRWYKSLDPEFRMAGMGSNVAMTGGQQAIQTGAGMGQTTLAGGQARAAGQLGSAYPYSQLANWGATNLMQYGMGSQNQAFNQQAYLASLPTTGAAQPWEPPGLTPWGGR